MTYMRYISTGGESIALDGLGEKFKEVAPKWTFMPTPPGEYADVEIEGFTYAEIEIMRADDELFDDEVAALREEVEALEESLGKFRVLEVLNAAKIIVGLQVVYPFGETDEMVATLDTLWDWLLEIHGGLLQIDDEGYYDLDHMILEL